MGAIFVSYRREDSEGQARALVIELADLIGKESVFMDVDGIAIGRDFRQILQERLASCEYMLALIGPNWLDAKDAAGNRRLDSSTDFVRQEIAAALKRNIPVIPVFVRGAQMPAPERLPDDLKDLAYRNGFELSHTRWESDVREMVNRLGLDSAGVGHEPVKRASESEGAGARGGTTSSQKPGRRIGAGDGSVWGPGWQKVAIIAGVSLAALVGLVAFLRPAAIFPVVPPAAQNKAAVPRLNYGVWTLRGRSIDGHTLDNSTLEFTSQSETADGLALEGTFAWRLDDVLLGEETVTGHYVAATQQIFLKGVAVRPVPNSEIAKHLVPGSYSAVMSVDQRALVNGRNGSTAEAQNEPLQWEAVR